MRHHACKGHRRRHALRSWKNWEWMAHPKGWKTLMAAQTLSTSTSRRRLRIRCRKAIPEWIWQRWPYEVLQSLPTIDSERVRDAVCSFRRRASCAGDHLVIEMLLNHWTEDQDMLWARQLVTMVKKKNGKLTMRNVRPIAMLPTMYRLYSTVLQQLAGQAIRTRYGPQYGHVPCRQAHEVVFILRRMVEQANEWRIPIFVMD